MSYLLNSSSYTICKSYLHYANPIDFTLLFISHIYYTINWLIIKKPTYVRHYMVWTARIKNPLFKRVLVTHNESINTLISFLHIEASSLTFSLSLSLNLFFRSRNSLLKCPSLLSAFLFLYFDLIYDLEFLNSFFSLLPFTDVASVLTNIVLFPTFISKSLDHKATKSTSKDKMYLPYSMENKHLSFVHNPYAEVSLTWWNSHIGRE